MRTGPCGFTHFCCGGACVRATRRAARYELIAAVLANPSHPIPAASSAVCSIVSRERAFVLFFWWLLAASFAPAQSAVAPLCTVVVPVDRDAALVPHDNMQHVLRTSWTRRASTSAMQASRRLQSSSRGKSCTSSVVSGTRGVVSAGSAKLNAGVAPLPAPLPGSDMGVTCEGAGVAAVVGTFVVVSSGSKSSSYSS